MANKRITYKSDTVDLIETFYLSKEKAHDHIPAVFYDIVKHDTREIVGNIDLRLEMSDDLYYYGSVGYDVLEEYRGHHYALDACKIIVTVAKDVYKMKELIFTCNPDNMPSKRTIENLGCEYIETREVPISHVLYWRGEKIKDIYKYVL